MAGEKPAYTAWIRSQPCAASLLSECDGGVCAHHTGRKGLSQRAHDDTCIPLCHQHHMEWHAAGGPFKGWGKAQRREWSEIGVGLIRALYEM